MKNFVVLLQFLLFVLLIGSAGLASGQNACDSMTTEPAYERMEDASGF